MMLDAECRTEMEIAMLANEDFRGDTAWEPSFGTGNWVASSHWRWLYFQGKMQWYAKLLIIYSVTHFQVIFFKSTTFYIILLYLTTHFESFSR